MGFHCFVYFLVLSESHNFPHKSVKNEIQKKTPFSLKSSMKISSWIQHSHHHGSCFGKEFDVCYLLCGKQIIFFANGHNASVKYKKCIPITSGFHLLKPDLNLAHYSFQLKRRIMPYVVIWQYIKLFLAINTKIGCIHRDLALCLLNSNILVNKWILYCWYPDKSLEWIWRFPAITQSYFNLGYF